MASNQESDIFLKSFHGSSNKMENEDSTNLDIEERATRYKEILGKHSHEDILQWLRDKNLGNIASNIVMKSCYTFNHRILMYIYHYLTINLDMYLLS